MTNSAQTRGSFDAAVNEPFTLCFGGSLPAARSSR